MFNTLNRLIFHGAAYERWKVAESISRFFRDQRDGFHIDKPCWVYVNDPVTFSDCVADVFPGLAKLASRLMEVPGKSVPGKLYNLILAQYLNMLLIYKIRKEGLVNSESQMV